MYQRGVPPQATYTFKHPSIQDAAYPSLLRSTRQQYHQRIAQVLEGHFPETTETQPELLAYHFTEAGLHAPAIEAWRKAGQRSAARSAYTEAVAHVTKGLESARWHARDRDTHRAGTDIAPHAGYGTPDDQRVCSLRPWNRSTPGPELSQQVHESPQLLQSVARSAGVLSGAWRLPHGPRTGRTGRGAGITSAGPRARRTPITRSAIPCSPWSICHRPRFLMLPGETPSSQLGSRPRLATSSATLVLT